MFTRLLAACLSVALLLGIGSAGFAGNRVADGESLLHGIPGDVQGAVRLLGEVRDAHGYPVPFARVGTSCGARVSADGAGRFAVQSLAARSVSEIEVVARDAVRGRAVRRVGLLPGGEIELEPLVLSAPLPCEPDWLPTFSPLLEGVDGTVRSLAVFHGPAGPELFLGGGFSRAGDQEVANVARFRGNVFQPAGAGLPGGQVEQLLVCDLGSGEELLAFGSFLLPDPDPAAPPGATATAHVARWSGFAWETHPADFGQPFQRVLFFDDGTGPGLAAHGPFGVARWDGQSWDMYGSPAGLGKLASIAVFDGGQGPALYAAGWESSAAAGGFPHGRLSRWQAGGWFDIPTSIPFPITELAVRHLASGPELLLGLGFGGIRTWNGSQWGSLPMPWYSSVSRIHVIGTDVLATGTFEASQVPGFFGATWNGFAFTAPNGSILSFALFDEGGGPVLYLGGSFTEMQGKPASGITRLSQGLWTGLLAGTALDGPVHALAAGSVGSGTGSAPSLFVGGGFLSAGIELAVGAAIWNGTWQAHGSPQFDLSWDLAMEPVLSYTILDFGQGPKLVRGGMGGLLAAWDGAIWGSIGSADGTSDQTFYPGPWLNPFPRICALQVFGSGAEQKLYIGGSFESVSGVESKAIAAWDGSGWSDVAGAFAATAPWIMHVVQALARFDNGTGEVLVTAGTFTTIAGQPASNVAAWDGASWRPMGQNLPPVMALEVWEGPQGPELVAAAAERVWRWDGIDWSPLPGAFTGTVRALRGVQFGDGPASLIAGGDFDSVDGLAANRLARWDGNAWSPLGSGVPGTVRALLVHDDGRGPALWVGGDFAHSPAGDGFLARWGCPPLFSLTGCAGPAPSLKAEAPAMLGKNFRLELWPLEVSPGSAPDPRPALLGWLFEGRPGWDAAGCGTAFAGLGDLLLALQPEPLLLAQTLAGAFPLTWNLAIPPDLHWLGTELHFQAVLLTADLGAQLSTSLSARLQPAP